MSETLARPGRIIPKEAREAGAKQARTNKHLTGAGYWTGIMTGMLVIILLVATLIGAIWFDLAGLKGQTIRLFGLEKGAQAILEVQRQDLQDTQNRLTNQELELANLEKSLKNRESNLASKEKQLASQLDQLTAAKEEQNTELASQAELVLLYEAMDSGKLAAVLSSSQNLADHLPVLLLMNKNKLSLVLSEMNATDAEKVLQALSVK